MQTLAFEALMAVTLALPYWAGVVPRAPRKACADGYALRIGKRATLVKAPGSVAWGMVYALTSEDLAKLYGAPKKD